MEVAHSEAFSRGNFLSSTFVAPWCIAQPTNSIFVCSAPPTHAGRSDGGSLPTTRIRPSSMENVQLRPPVRHTSSPASRMRADESGRCEAPGPFLPGR